MQHWISLIEQYLVAVLIFYENKVSYDEVLSSHFNIDNQSYYHINAAAKQLLSRLDIIKDALCQSNETRLQQLELVRRKISE